MEQNNKNPLINRFQINLKNQHKILNVLIDEGLSQWVK